MSSSIRTTVHESLPYVDAEPTAAERAAAESLIAAEASSSSPPPESSSTPATLPPVYTPTFTPLITSELNRISAKEPLTGIDLTRYEASSPPSSPNPNSPSNTTLSSLQTSLSRAYTSSTYLSSRQTHLHLLDTYGKNQWLVGNWQLEAEVQALERELAETKREIDVVNIQRRRVQDEVGGELKGLDETWKRGVSRVLETEVVYVRLRCVIGGVGGYGMVLGG
ncbi:Pre-mRNA-splicing factor SPF27 [Annulohypoxylon maeteangense]|uniref:Pre-mRNA-splicing factor SPF27 n=1 Tax=Annulohypoxylon maeteangense TaxID=1927788 RepID=UPI00200812A0|nr:Pre-mRNA-splicing factor SPF27 [Annulohypoxylon maeteangense]KAI0885423.1 Pre-mRNA-splicing factor SPF27 [Annulohypoxylon maeteangense]